MAPHYHQLNRRKPIFRISSRNARVEEWARGLLSPNAQDVPVPSWYTTYLKSQNVLKEIATPDTLPPPSSSSAPARYNLRSSKSQTPTSTIQADGQQPVPPNNAPQKKDSPSSSNHNQPGPQARYNLRSTTQQVIKSKITTAVNSTNLDLSKVQKRP